MVRCGSCGHEELAKGFIEESGQGSRGYARWFEGPLETGMFGVRRFRRRRGQIHALRCTRCGHLELFVRHVE
jgi:DNA-directed RNA polymerase subunit RPC12/RpoP